MKKTTNELLEELIKQLEGEEDFYELRDALFNAELTAHLGHKKGEKPKSSNIRHGYSEKHSRPLMEKLLSPL